MGAISDRWSGALRRRSATAWLITVNVGVFLAVRITAAIAELAGSANPAAILQWLALPSSPSVALMEPWTMVTYMFTQYDVLHLLFNMVWLYWFGRMFMLLSTSGRMLAVYALGGITGAAVYLTACAAVPGIGGSMLLGSSAAVLAIVTATAMAMPDYGVSLFLLGEVKLKWIAVTAVALDLLGMSAGNAGGHIAHLGGAAAGLLYGLALRRGYDVYGRVRRFAKSARRRRHSRGRTGVMLHVDTRRGAEDARTLDELLDKVKRSGYSSLTDAERAELYDISNRITDTKP